MKNFKHRLVLLYEWMVRSITYFLPDIPFFMALRGKLYSLTLKKCGRNFQVAHNVILRSSDSIEIGDDVYVANNCVILGGGTIRIGNEVIIGPGVVLASRTHTFDGNSFRFSDSEPGIIEIEDGCWVCANCTVASGAKLPGKSILSANSLLKNNFEEEKSLYGGVPARFIKKLC